MSRSPGDGDRWYPGRAALAEHLGPRAIHPGPRCAGDFGVYGVVLHGHASCKTGGVRLRLALGVSLLSIACASSQGGEGTSEDEVAGHRYVDLSAAAPMTGVARQKMLRALARLDRVAHEAQSPLRRDLATEVLARIQSGDVLLGSIEASRGIDRWHMCKDYGMPACEGAPPASDDRTWLGDEALAEKLRTDLAGYQWGNRIYFTLGEDTDVNELAATLVHETVHVAHRSECNYYTVIDRHVVEPDPAYVEEYRSFLSECYFADDAANVDTCTAYAKGRTDEYGYAAQVQGRAALTEELLAKDIVPRKNGWPSAFGACSPR